MKPGLLPQEASAVIIGGGIAGIASAWHLAALGATDVVLLEAEPVLAAHASGRNAAIFRPLEESASAIWLANRSQTLLDAQLGTSWLKAHGLVLVSAAQQPIQALRVAAHRYSVFHESWDHQDLDANLPLLQGGEARHAIRLPFGGVMDTAGVLEHLRRGALGGGVRICTGVRVDAIETREQRVTSVLLSDGQRLPTTHVVLAAGAWASQLGQSAGADLPLTPRRRHLAQLALEEMPAPTHPVIWRVDDQVYFRPEGRTVLASPCDEAPALAGEPQSDRTALEPLQRKLSALAPDLGSAQLQRTWACLRTMADDDELVVGADPRVIGLHWIAGLGGRGMTCGVAAGELLARTLSGLPHPLAGKLSPTRLL